VSVRRTHRAGPGIADLASEFPSVAFDVETAVSARGTPLPTIDLVRWNDRRIDFAPFDGHLDDLARKGRVTLVVRGLLDEALRGAGEMLTRWQRLLDRRNWASSTPVFDSLLARLQALHDMSKPLVRADWNHAVDTWQWVLRLRPGAGCAEQMAALLHDVERLESEADARIEHLAPSYEAFKKEHARRGSQISRALLDACGANTATRERVAALVAGHERPNGDPGRDLLNDADALSFFSQNSAGYLDYFGADATRRKVSYSLRRMREAARIRLPTIRLRADVQLLVDDVTAEEAAFRAPAHLARSRQGQASA
jgi:hypothetical protein